jgi:uncharacterized damage-inducible protein DinB
MRLDRIIHSLRFYGYNSGDRLDEMQTRLPFSTHFAIQYHIISCAGVTEVRTRRGHSIRWIVRETEKPNTVDLLDRLLGHDVWTTRQLLGLCAAFSEEQLDHEYDIGHRTLRATLDHIVRNVEVWSSLMAGDAVERQSDRTVTGMTERLAVAAERLRKIARQIADRDAWDETWHDHLDDPPREKSYGAGIAHIITHSMHHRAQVLYMLRLSGVTPLPEGDVFSWENRIESRTGQ